MNSVNPSVLCLEYIRWAVRHSRNASVRRLDHPPVVCSPVFDPVQLMIRGDLKEMEVYNTHSFICFIVSFPSGQHILIYFLLWLKMVKQGRCYCPSGESRSTCFCCSFGGSHSQFNIYLIYLILNIVYILYIYILNIQYIYRLYIYTFLFSKKYTLYTT